MLARGSLAVAATLEITLRGEYNIGLATATDDGLVVPVLKHAQAKDVSELAREADELIRAARERRLRPDQLSGGTFTVNNYGSLGVWLGTPIIKPGEVANLGFGRVQERPVAVEGRVEVRPIVALSVSGDHRVLDGATVGRALADVEDALNGPIAAELRELWPVGRPAAKRVRLAPDER